MNREADQQDLEPFEPESPSAAAPQDAIVGAGTVSASQVPDPAKTAKRRAGVPVWRSGKPDAFLAAAVDTARDAIAGITAPSDIGRHLAAKSEGDRLVTHLFECRLPGYGGWQWFAVLTRNSRSKVVTVSELGLLPSEDSILAPEWVPWAERVRPEDEQEPEPESGRHQAREPEAADHDAGAGHADAPGTAASEPADGGPAASEPADGGPATQAGTTGRNPSEDDAGTD